MTPIITNILTNISKKLDSLIDSNRREKSYIDYNTSNCLVCDSSDLSITYTKKHKKGYSYRIAVCNECGSSNKQVIMTIEGKRNPDLIILRGWKKKAFFKPIDLFEINGEISLDGKFLSKVKKEYLNNEIGFLKKNEKKSILSSITEGEGHDLVISQWQKNYDDGLFDVAKNSIDPVNIRFTHEFPIKSTPAMALRILFPTTKFKLDIFTVFINATVQKSVVNKDGYMVNNFHVMFNKVGVKVK
tara:strand:- start:907 stop:1638 length:732 start_codon:yes stop_codon:yes gene_type:complete